MSTVNEHTLYKFDSKGKLRVWWIEFDETRYRTHSGLKDGKTVASGWLYPEKKNVGRSNETSIADQIYLEINAEYTKKLNQGKYHETEVLALGGANFIECMLADTYDPKKHNAYPYFSQPKLDGIRCLISKDGMTSRQGKPIVSCPHIMESLRDFFVQFPGVVLDGELYNHKLKDDFERISSLIGKKKPTAEDFDNSKTYVQYHIYDCLFGDDSSFEDRWVFLLDSIPLTSESNYQVFLVPTKQVASLTEGQNALRHYLRQGYEGQILRVKNSVYEGKRSKNLIKWKATADLIPFQDAEFEILEIKAGKGSWAGKAKSIKIKLDDGQTQSVGVAGAAPLLESVLKNASDYKWVTVQFQNRTKKNKLRFPVAIKFYKGKREL
jgi:DNA ligase 1